MILYVSNNTLYHLYIPWSTRPNFWALMNFLWRNSFIQILSALGNNSMQTAGVTTEFSLIEILVGWCGLQLTYTSREVWCG